MKVFLGGTCNGSNWREQLIPLLTVDYFNPVVNDWNASCKAEEIKQRKICDIRLYVITPAMTGVYSIAEVVDDSNKHPNSTILVVLEEDQGKSFDVHQLKSLNSVTRMVEANGAYCFTSLSSAAHFINHEA